MVDLILSIDYQRRQWSQIHEVRTKHIRMNVNCWMEEVELRNKDECSRLAG